MGEGTHTVMVLVKDARYYQDQKSILVVGVETETRRQITQQVLTTTFIQAAGLPASLVDDHPAWHHFASQLKHRSQPLRIQFDGSKTEADQI